MNSNNFRNYEKISKSPKWKQLSNDMAFKILDGFMKHHRSDVIIV
jgi:hypothetical protein